jgi:hypothetical protein
MGAPTIGLTAMSVLEKGEHSGAPAAGRAAASFAPTLALAVALTLGAAGVVLPLVHAVLPAVLLPPPLAIQHQRAETLTFLLTFFAALPAALAVAPRIVARTPPGFAVLPLAGLVLVVLGTRLADAAGVSSLHALLGLSALWWLAVGALVARPPSWRAPTLRLPALPRRSAPALGRPWGIAVDLAALLLLALVVPDLVIFRPEAASGNLSVALETSIIRFHQDLLLEPANEVIHGGAMLVDAASQYGVGSIYAIAAWFKVAPIGYGTFGFLDDALTALWFCAGYGVLRLAGVARPLAVGALALAVVALVFPLAFPVGALPQYGPLRFGMPMLVVLAAVAEARWPRRASVARAAGLAALGLASVWSLEALAYTGFVYAALACLQERLDPRPGARRRLVRRAALAVAACVAAQVLLAAATLVASGSLPDWGEYLVFLHAFLFGKAGEFTYDVPAWSPSLALGAGYVASAAAVIELARRRAALPRVALIALGGLTAYGIALFSYYVDRSQSHILMHVALPGLLAGALWLSLLLRIAGDAARTAALACALVLTALLVAIAWPSIGDRFPRTALAHAAPGGESFRGALTRLWHPPVMEPATATAERLVRDDMPGERRSLLMTEQDRAIEVLLRTGRLDRLHIGDPWETGFVAGHWIGRLRATVDGIRPGTRMLIDQAALDRLAYLRAHPEFDPLSTASAPAAGALTALQQWALRRIGQRFRFHTVAVDGKFRVVELRP